MASATLKLGVLISGSGTNLQAIIDSIERGELKTEIRIVISDRPDAFGLERARGHGLRTLVVERSRYRTREDFDQALAAELRAGDVELVACAGFLRLFSPVMLEAFPGRIMNIHPALLPAFPGLHAQKAAVEYGVRFAGCTVFFVTEGVDNGPIIVQAMVPVDPDDDEQSLTERILAQEHRIFPYAIRLFQEGRLEIRGRKVHIRDAAPPNFSLAMMNPPLR